MSKLIDTILDAAQDIVFVRNDVELGRVDAAGNVTTKGSVNGGSMPDVMSSITRNTMGRVTAWTDVSGSYTVTYSATTGLAATVSNGTTTRTISRDSFGRVTGVA